MRVAGIDLISVLFVLIERRARVIVEHGNIFFFARRRVRDLGGDLFPKLCRDKSAGVQFQSLRRGKRESIGVRALELVDKARRRRRSPAMHETERDVGRLVRRSPRNYLLQNGVSVGKIKLVFFFRRTLVIDDKGVFEQHIGVKSREFSRKSAVAALPRQKLSRLFQKGKSARSRRQARRGKKSVEIGSGKQNIRLFIDVCGVIYLDGRGVAVRSARRERVRNDARRRTPPFKRAFQVGFGRDLGRGDIKTHIAAVERHEHIAKARQIAEIVRGIQAVTIIGRGHRAVKIYLKGRKIVPNRIFADMIKQNTARLRSYHGLAAHESLPFAHRAVGRKDGDGGHISHRFGRNDDPHALPRGQIQSGYMRAAYAVVHDELFVHARHILVLRRVCGSGMRGEIGHAVAVKLLHDVGITRFEFRSAASREAERRGGKQQEDQKKCRDFSHTH